MLFRLWFSREKLIEWRKGSVMALVVQLFFCYRIYIIKREALPLSIFIALVSLLQAAGGIGGGISAYLSANEVHDHNRIIFVYIWLIGDGEVFRVVDPRLG